jgi:hypothetical protein
MINEQSQSKESYLEECYAGIDVDADEGSSGTDHLCIHRSKRAI